jgi:hypothetical protein
MSQNGASGWTRGTIYFAGALLILIGLFDFFTGLAGIIDDKFFVVQPNYFIGLDVSGWGWIHVILGVVVAAAGFGVFVGATWARVVGIIVAGLSAVANFLFIPHYPIWSLLIIALDVWVIWVLAVHGREMAP